jgi:type VI secretion system secreted protein VgrG
VRKDFKQTGGFLTIDTPFGDDDLILDNIEGSEGISELFKFNLFMRSGSTNLAPNSIVGKKITVTMQLKGSYKRYIHGTVSRFIQSGFDVDFASYQAEIVPDLWLLTLNRDRKIYQNKTVLEIIKAVLADSSIKFSDKTTGSYTAIDYCVQYDETDFEFISRLMEHHGIYYYFTFTSSGHTMVLGDAASAHITNADSANLRFFPLTGQTNSIDTIFRFEHENRVVLKKATVSDFDFEKPATSLSGENSASNGSGTLYEFGSGSSKASESTSLAKIRVQASQSYASLLRGDSFAYSLSAGTSFTLSKHFLTSLNAEFVVRRIHHTARDDLYSNSFEAFPSSTQFRPPLVTPLPRAVGNETAKVVGPSGEEIWTDKYGRIKVQFPWDRDGVGNDKSSCWVRVSQSLAGSGFGALFLPRVGQEVVIGYLNGDPSRPLVTGCVYNGLNTTPVKLPDNQTQSTIATWSSKQGTAGNIIRFEDKKDSEQLYFHAQKDLLTEVENALTTTVKKGDEIHTIEKGDRTIDVKTGKEIHNVKGTRAIDITGDETHTNAGNFKHTVKGDFSLTVDGKLTINVTGEILVKSSASVTNQAGSAMNIKAGTALTNEAGTALTNKAGTELTNQAGTNLTNKAGVNLTNQASVQLQNKGAMISSKADAMHSVEAGAMMTVKGALTQIN